MKLIATIIAALTMTGTASATTPSWSTFPHWLEGDVKKAANSRLAFERDPMRVASVRCRTEIVARQYYCILRLRDGERGGATIRVDLKSRTWHIWGDITPLG